MVLEIGQSYSPVVRCEVHRVVHIQQYCVPICGTYLHAQLTVKLIADVTAQHIEINQKFSMLHHDPLVPKTCLVD